MDHDYLKKPVANKSRNTKYCCVPQCGTYGASGISFHLFPKDKVMKKKWQTALRISKPISPAMRVCSHHFQALNYFPNNTKRQKLFPNAVPSQNIPKRSSAKDVTTLARKMKSSDIRHRKIVSSSKDLGLAKNEEIDMEDGFVDNNVTDNSHHIVRTSLTEIKKNMTKSYHNNICRMCLSVGVQNMHSLIEEPDILEKIYDCLSVRINIEDSFPNQVCKDCIEKILDIHDYHQKVITNEKLLISHANMGQNELEQFYLSLKNMTPDIKEESDLNILKEESDLNIQDGDIKLDDNVKSEQDELENYNETTENDKMPFIVANPNDNDERSRTPIDNAIDHIEDPNVAEHSPMKNDKYENDLTEKTDDSATNLISVSTFKCLTCFEICDSKSQLLSHYNSKHKMNENPVKAECLPISLSEGEETYKCTVCNELFNTKSVAHKHIQEHSRSFICKICGRTYRTASDIVRHGRAHDGSSLFCSHKCGYSTAYLGALVQHEKRHNGHDHKYKCEECGKGFQVKTWYDQHQNLHKGLKPFICDICGVAFHMDRYLTAHRSSVHPQTSNVKRYVCPHCSLPCDSRKALTEHLKEHGIKSSFLCDLCGKTLSNAEQLKFHKRTHLGVKPYSCSTCDKSFTKKFNLQLHERTHSGEKSYACDLCGKHYSQRSALLRHNHRHHSENKLKCSKCSKTFAAPNLLSSHQKLCT